MNMTKEFVGIFLACQCKIKKNIFTIILFREI